MLHSPSLITDKVSYAFCLVFSSALIVSCPPAHASVSTKPRECFRRDVDTNKVVARYPNCLVYIGTYGLRRSLWGMQVKGKFRIQAHSDAGSKVVYANGKEAILFTSNGKSPDTLRKDEYFCIGFKGDSTDTCAHGFLMPMSR